MSADDFQLLALLATTDEIRAKIVAALSEPDP